MPGASTLFLLSLLLAPCAAHAHVGSKDIFEQLQAGPYKLFVTVRPPTVIPGVATVEVRSGGAAIETLSLTPVPMVGEASHHPPTPDRMSPAAQDPQFFRGSVWLMGSGSWKVQLAMTGAAGPATAGIPVPAMPLAVLRMNRPLGLLLGALGLLLAVGIAGIVAAAARESRLAPGLPPSPARRRRALVAGVVTLALVAVAAALGGKWWNVEAADYAGDVYRPLDLQPRLTGNVLRLRLGDFTSANARRSRSGADLLPDHGHLMHLYAIREPGMDAAFHLHPSAVAPGELETVLPTMPPGRYRLFADIVHRSGFPETLTATLEVPPGLPPAPLDAEDAAAAPPPRGAAALGTSYKLPDGYTMRWDRPAGLAANQAYVFQFQLLDPQGQPATNMQPYLGMAGHAAFVKADGSTFAHTHPEGSAAMPAMMLANAGAGDGPATLQDRNAVTMTGMDGGQSSSPARSPEPLSSTVGFPYGFHRPAGTASSSR